MTKNVAILLLLILFVPLYSYTSHPPTWATKYKVSVAAGAMIGVTTGTLCALIDASTGLALCPITWYAARDIRRTFTKSISKTLEEDSIRHCRYVIHDTAWLTSWASWCVLMRLLW